MGRERGAGNPIRCSWRTCSGLPMSSLRYLFNISDLNILLKLLRREHIVEDNGRDDDRRPSSLSNRRVVESMSPEARLLPASFFFFLLIKIHYSSRSSRIRKLNMEDLETTTTTSVNHSRPTSYVENPSKFLSAFETRRPSKSSPCRLSE